MANNISKPQSGVLTNSMDVESREFKEHQLFLLNKIDAMSKSQKSSIELFALQVKIEDYLNTSEKEIEVVTVGDFLRLYLEKLNIKQNALAKYIGLKPSNFSKILSGTRKINLELSLMLGQIFNLDPKAWILIQVKNEFIELRRRSDLSYTNYSLDDLI